MEQLEGQSTIKQEKFVSLEEAVKLIENKFLTNTAQLGADTIYTVKELRDNLSASLSAGRP